MTTIITLTPALRVLPFFSSFKGKSVEVPAKPFLRELLEGTIRPEELLLSQLFDCIETCEFFKLDPSILLQEALWKMGESKESLSQWIVPCKQKPSYFTWSPSLPTLVHLELIDLAGSFLDDKCFIRLGFRHLKPSLAEIVAEGNLRLLKWACREGLGEFLPCEVNAATSEAAKNGYLSCLQYLVEQGCGLYVDICNEAADNGHLNCIQYAHERGCPWSEWTVMLAARNGHLDCLKYLHEHGCPWDISAMYATVSSGHLDCLMYLHEQGCPWNGKICAEAAKAGQLECLKYLHEHGCPWNIETSRAANKHLDCLQYAHEHGCPWDGYSTENASKDCYRYMVEHGCPRNSWNNYRTVNARQIVINPEAPIRGPYPMNKLEFYKWKAHLVEQGLAFHGSECIACLEG